MAVNKNAQIRYNALDKCFSNKYKKYYINDLIEYCCHILTDHYGKDTTVSRRQILDDINFMRSTAGYSAPIESIKDGRQVYYRYDDSNFSILTTPLNPNELEALNQAVVTLGRMKNIPGFDWVELLEAKLNASIESSQNANQIIDFEENEFLKGIEYLGVLYPLIANKQTIEIKYQSFKSDNSSLNTVSPYYLKQYNNRWFLFGWNHQYDKLQNVALDRVVSISNSKAAFINSNIDFEEYFEDIIGVTNNLALEAQEIKIALSDTILPYIQSKPLHGSQKITANTLTLHLKINYELETLILSYGENMKVIEPQLLKDKVIERIKKMYSIY